MIEVNFTHGWIATDLDGTLFSRANAAADAVPGTWNVGPDGSREPSSWVSAPTHRLMKALAANFAIVPVTARDLASYQRVAIPHVPFSGAVLSNGAIMLRPDGELDEGWTQAIDQELAHWQAPWQELLTRLTVSNVRPRLVMSAGEHAAYLVAKAPAGWWQSEDGTRLISSLPDCGLKLDVLGVELQILPPCVSKARGVQAFMTRHAGEMAPLLGLGDMPADAEFMRLATFQGMPSNSPLARLWQP